ncbi:MAG: ABC transporter ATP-binding protein [Acetobacter sp.]
MTALQTSQGTHLQIVQLRKAYGPTTVLHSINLEAEPGSVLSLLGSSGCGKTTVLQAIAGFVRPDGGNILLDGQSILSTPPEKRRTVMLFQGYALFPHMSVRDNVGFGLRMARMPRHQAQSAVDDALRRMRIEALADRRPMQLSGGQKQRVALARAIVTQPRLLLLDEPLGALDQNLREEMQFEIARLQRATQLTTVIVTHDQAEAMTLSDRIAVLNNGRVEQVGSPMTIFDRPANRYVAHFMGVANILDVAVDTSGIIRLAGTVLPGLFGKAGLSQIAIRAEFLQLCKAEDSLAVQGRVRECRPMGAQLRYTVVLSDSTEVIALVTRSEDMQAPEVGQPVGLKFPSEYCTILQEGN